MQIEEMNKRKSMRIRGRSNTPFVLLFLTLPLFFYEEAPIK